MSKESSIDMDKESSKVVHKESSKYYKTTSIKLPRDLWRKIKIEAIKRDMTISELIEFALNQVVCKESSMVVSKESSKVVNTTSSMHMGKESSKSLRKESSMHMDKEILEEKEIEEVSTEKGEEEEDLKELLRKEVELTEEEMRLHGHVKVSEEDRARIGDEIVKILSEKGALMPKELLKELIDRGFSPRKSERIMAELVKKGVIEVCEAEMGKWGKQSFLRLKEK